MVDRYRKRPACACGKVFEPSCFDGLKGTVTKEAPEFMVLIDDESKPMRFDPRDFDEVAT